MRELYPKEFQRRSHREEGTEHQDAVAGLRGGARGRACSGHVFLLRQHAGVRGETRGDFARGHGARPFQSSDPDTGRIWWSEVGVHQNLTFPVQPDPVSGMHCWHQRVRLSKAGPDDAYGDIVVDTEEAHRAYKEWMAKTRPAPGPGGLRRPLWFDRPLRPVPGAYSVPE